MWALNVDTIIPSQPCVRLCDANLKNSNVRRQNFVDWNLICSARECIRSQSRVVL